MCRVLLIVALLCVAATHGLADAQRESPGIPAVPIDPITGILDAFKTHEVVALSEGNHGNEQGHAFRVAIIDVSPDNYLLETYPWRTAQIGPPRPEPRGAYDLTGEVERDSFISSSRTPR